MTNATTLVYKSTTFNPVPNPAKTGVWLRVNQIGLALGYTNPDLSVSKLYRANADEFTPSMTALVKIQTAGGEQEVRVFSLRGAHLLGMFARTAEAKDFRVWALDILDNETPAPLALESSTITKEQTGIIYQTLCAKYPNGDNRHAAWSRFNKYFNLNEYKSLPASRFDEAMKWLGGAVNKLPPPLPSPDEPTPKPFKFECGVRHIITTNDDGESTFYQLKQNDFIANMGNLAKRIHDLAFGAEDETLINIINACKNELTARVTAQEKRLDHMKRLLTTA